MTSPVPSVSRFAGDVVRACGVLSLVGALATGKGVAAALFALVLLGLTLLRLLVRPGLDAATGAMLVAGAWASLLDLYVRVPWLDVPVHFLATGLGAAALHQALVSLEVLPAAEAPLPRRAAVGAGVAIVGLGFVLGVLWELAEWYGDAYVDDRIQVGYEDTLGDLTAGGAGAVVAAAVTTLLAARGRRRPPGPSGRPVGTVSVVIPVKDDAPLLRRCLGALAEQTVRPVEVVVVDNGSTDDSAAVAAAYGARVVEERTPGIPAAAAAGYDAARGDVIARCDADSIPPPDWVDRLVRTLAAADADAVTGPGTFYDLPRGVRGPMQWLYLGTYFVSLHLALGHPVLWGSNMAMRREVWAEVRDAVHRQDPELHDDIDLAFVLGPGRRIRHDPGLRVGVSARCLKGRAQLRRRLRRAVRTLRVGWADQPPWRRWAVRFAR